MVRQSSSMSKMKLIIFVSLCLVGVCVGAPKAIEFDACDARDPNFDDCIRASVQIFFGKLNGSGPISEPLKAAQLILGPGEKLFNARLELLNVETNGWSQTKFEIAKVSTQRRNATMRGIAPSLRITAPYRASGSILDSSLNREGILTAVLENVVWQWTINLEVLEKEDGEKYWRRISSNVSLLPERVRLELTNQSVSLGRDIDENWRYLFVELRSDYENIINAVLGRLADSLYDQAPIKTFIINFEEYSLK